MFYDGAVFCHDLLTKRTPGQNDQGLVLSPTLRVPDHKLGSFWWICIRMPATFPVDTSPRHLVAGGRHRDRLVLRGRLERRTVSHSLRQSCLGSVSLTTWALSDKNGFGSQIGSQRDPDATSPLPLPNPVRHLAVPPACARRARKSQSSFDLEFDEVYAGKAQ